MIKRIALILSGLLLLGTSSAYAVAPQSKMPKTLKTTATAHMQAVRVAALFESLAEQTATLLNGAQVTEQQVEMYLDTLKRIGTYSDCSKALNSADIELLTNAFYKFAKAGGESLTKDDIRSDFCEFESIGQLAETLSNALMQGWNESTAK